jgi:exodeoxyribonuclease V alpha subunit
MSDKPHEVLEGIVERITYQSPETGYTVFKLQVPRAAELTTVVGELADLYVGESLQLSGLWLNHPKHGYQFKVQRYQKLLPATVVGLEKYLGSGLIKGVGPITAKRMVKTFGTDILKIIEEEPERLQEIPLIGAKKQALITQSWNEHKEIQNVMMFLQAHGVSTTFAVKIFKRYGNDAIRLVEANPYRLAEDIWGIGFKTADRLAQALGHALESPSRLRAGLVYTLQKSTEEGHVYLPQNELIQRATEILTVDAGLLPEAILALGRDDMVVLETDPNNPDVFLVALHQSEKRIVQRLKRLLETPVQKPHKTQVGPWLATYQQQQGMALSSEQEEAVRQATSRKVFILTGGPGTGKTTVSRSIIAWFTHIGKTVLLASPTGRAAKRLSEVTGEPAKTIHRLLEFDPRKMRFKRDETQPLEADVVLLDEVSMVDLVLFHQLLKAIPEQAHLILVGDSDQLPSVGPGAVLKHLLASERIPSVQLRQIFRQAEASLIIRNAHRLNQGIFPELLAPTPAHRDQDCFFIPLEEPEAMVETILDLVTRRLPKAGHTPEDIQVLCPMNRGLVGSQNLNQQLQAALNPLRGQAEMVRGARLLRVGDRVIQLRNNYDRDVFNGDMGILKAIDREDQTFVVKYPEQEVVYDLSEQDELALAYALSVHKSQGSEYPVVILPVATQHYMMLQRNLLYTGMTRARKLLIWVGSKKALAIAVKNHRLRERYSHLRERLEETL